MKKRRNSNNSSKKKVVAMSKKERIETRSKMKDIKSFFMKLTDDPKFSLDGKTPGRSHLRRGDHIYPQAITSCPGQAQCMPWARCDRPGVNVIAPA